MYMKSIKLIALLAVSVVLQPAVYAHHHKDHWVKKAGKITWHAAETYVGLLVLYEMIKNNDLHLIDPRSWITGNRYNWKCEKDWTKFDRTQNLVSGIITGSLLYHGISGLNDELHTWKRIQKLSKHMSKK